MIRHTASMDDVPGTEATQARNRRSLWWALPITLLSLALLYPIWRELGIAVFGPPEIVLREVFAPGDAAQVFDHSSFDALLRAHVDDQGFVDYGALYDEPAQLDAYLLSLGAADFDALGLDEKLAFLLNASNACTLRLMLDHWPVDSIREIPEQERWTARRWLLFGETLSLAELRDSWLRPCFAEPRIHFASSDASLGGPPLRAEAYIGARIDEQLTDQARRALANPRWANLVGDTGTLQLTQLLLRYGDDFAQTYDSVLAFVRANQPAVDALAATGTRIRVAWLEYDWRHNGQTNRPN